MLRMSSRSYRDLEKHDTQHLSHRCSEGIRLVEGQHLGSLEDLQDHEQQLLRNRVRNQDLVQVLRQIHHHLHDIRRAGERRDVHGEDLRLDIGLVPTL